MICLCLKFISTHYFTCTVAQSIPTPSTWRMAVAVLAALLLALFIVGFWNMVYLNTVGYCGTPITLVELLTLLLAGSGAYLLYIYIGRGVVNDVALVLFIVLAIVLAISLYSLSTSSFASAC